MDYDTTLEDTEGFERAKAMRDDFERLHDKLTDEQFDGTLTKGEFAKLLIGAYIVTNNLRDRVTILKKSIEGYEKDLMPKLQKIVDAPEEDTMKTADEVLILESKE